MVKRWVISLLFSHVSKLCAGLTWAFKVSYNSFVVLLGSLLGNPNFFKRIINHVSKKTAFHTVSLCHNAWSCRWNLHLQTLFRDCAKDIRRADPGQAKERMNWTEGVREGRRLLDWRPNKKTRSPWTKSYWFLLFVIINLQNKYLIISCSHICFRMTCNKISYSSVS